MTCPDAVGFRTAYGGYDSRPFQDVVDPASVALQLPLKCLDEIQRTDRGGDWLDLFYVERHHDDKTDTGVTLEHDKVSD